MVKKYMYQKIQRLKKQGDWKSEIARNLGIDRGTISKYYDMPESEYRVYQEKVLYRHKLLDNFRDDIIDVYRKNNFRKLNMSAVYDYLEEKHSQLPCNEKSFRNYIGYLIETGSLVLDRHVRRYQKVPELPFGQQMQLDFGQYKISDELKIYIFAGVLSASRYKYITFQDRPFTTIDVIKHLLDCFDYFGGIPAEMVIDQDALLVVSENRGDIVYTEKFSTFIEEMDLKMYVCRKADPESKGKVENLVKFVKYNFLQPRSFNCIEEACKSLRKWLFRRANGKISQATKRIPMELIDEEREHLKSIRNSIFRKDELCLRVERTVNDKSYIAVQNSHYSVPTKFRNRKVEIYTTDNRLFVFDSFTGKEIAEHGLSPIPQQTISQREHFRQTETKSVVLKAEVTDLFSCKEWREFTQINFTEFGRYVRDQCLDAKKYFKQPVDQEVLNESLKYCLENKTYSFANLNDTYQFLLSENQELPAVSEVGIIKTKIVPPVNVKNRSLSDYTEHISVGGIR